MAPTIDYYFAPQSPWTHLGHLRFWDIARGAGATIRVLPVLADEALSRLVPRGALRG